MKYIVAGGRDFNNYNLIKLCLDAYHTQQSCPDFNIDTIISGCARGTDQLAIQWAKENDVPIIYCPACWDEYGKSAGFIRNAEMGDMADAAICFWDGNSKGTAHMIKTMEKLKKPCFVYDYEGRLRQ